MKTLRQPLDAMEWHGQRVLIMGLGHFGGGVAAARWLARQGAVVTITDLADEAALGQSLAALRNVPLAGVHLGEHREADFQHSDVVVVNPAVKPGNPWLDIARRTGARLTSEMELFLEACPARTVGVTGTNGKSTTAALTAEILRAADHKVWLGGNIGLSLLEHLPSIAPEDWVVLEMSSFQLWRLSPETKTTDVAILTNCSPNHLDWHGSFDHYVAAKQRLLSGQTSEGLAVLGCEDEDYPDCHAGEKKPVPLDMIFQVRGRRVPIDKKNNFSRFLLPGLHNRQNAMCAATAAAAVGCSPRAIQEGFSRFQPLRQRLEPVGRVAGRSFVNDSASTTPESTIAALSSLDGPSWLLAGGGDKGADFQSLLETVAESACGAAFYGQVGERLARAMQQQHPTFPCVATDTLDEALRWCWRRANSGDTIVLSPGCSSHDQFQNYEARGRHFLALVRALCDQHDR